MQTTAAAFLVALRMMESGGDYQVVNTLNFLGAYQFGEAALIDLGYVRRDRDVYDNNYSGGWTGKNGVHSVNDFLQSRYAQDAAAEEWINLMWAYLEERNLDDYAWTEVGGIHLTPSAMLAATHLLGADAMDRFVASNGNVVLRDPYGMPITTYMVKLADFEVPVGPQAPTG
jgi:hypothetical protein